VRIKSWLEYLAPVRSWGILPQEFTYTHGLLANGLIEFKEAKFASIRVCYALWVHSQLKKIRIPNIPPLA
jgi:hypothetical protein